MTSKLSRKPCQVDVKIDPNLDNGVSVVLAFIVVRVDGSIVDGVTIDGSVDIHVSGTSRELGVVLVSDVSIIDGVTIDGSVDIHVSGTSRELGVVLVSDVEVGGNLVVGYRFVCSHLVVRDNSVDGHVVVAIFGVLQYEGFFKSFLHYSIQTRQRCGIGYPCLVMG